MDALLVFAIALVLDFVWAGYTKAITADRPWIAAVLAGVIMWLTGTNAIHYVSDHDLLRWAVLGAMAGTFLAVRRGKK